MRDDKQFYFLAGLHRSGTTLLSVLLNQNPNIYSSGQSDLLESIDILERSLPNLEMFKAGADRYPYVNMIKGIGNSFYSHIDKPIIVDKHMAWGGPHNLQLTKFLTKEPKILCPVRPILEILTSFVLLARETPGRNFIDSSLEQEDFWARMYRPIDDARCDWLMRPGGEIDNAILSVSQSIQHPNEFHIIQYKDIVNEPQKVMDGVYKFFNLPPYEHFFDNLSNPFFNNDDAFYGMPNLHKIRPTVNNTSLAPEEVLSDYVIEKYGNALNFLPGIGD